MGCGLPSEKSGQVLVRTPDRKNGNDSNAGNGAMSGGLKLVPGILADDAYKVWTELNPVLGRAVLWFGYLSKPTRAIVKCW